MNVIEWLKAKDETFVYLVDTHLKNGDIPYCKKGYIKRYLDLYDPNKKLWGNGHYGPKWISTHYTMLELLALNIDPNHPIYQEGLETLLGKYWDNMGMQKSGMHLDLCIVGMLLSLLSYGKHKTPKINEMIDHLLNHQFSDGGWNCLDETKHHPTKSSLHTTINVLEGLLAYQNSSIQYRKDEVSIALTKGNHFILRKKLIFSERTGQIIHQDMTKPHYPPRWKYDCFRALYYFAQAKHPYHENMEEALELARLSIKKGFVSKGLTYSGKLHFKLESSRAGGFNTYRVLYILKWFDEKYYQTILTIDINPQ